MDESGLPGRIEARFAGSLPGSSSQMRMCPSPVPELRPYREAEPSARKAGVLVLLYDREGRPSLVLTRRTDNIIRHGGQVSFPGGELKEGETAEAAAVRETVEELGLDPGRIRVVGRLTPLWIPSSNYCVYPTVGFHFGRPEFQPQPGEVAEVLEVSLEGLRDPANTRLETIRVKGRAYEAPCFDFHGNLVWGATAMILAELLDVLEAPA